MRKENEHNIFKKETTAFNCSVLYQHIIDGQKSVNQLAKLMFINKVLVWEHCQWLEMNNFVKIDMMKQVRQVKGYTAINVDKYVWPKSYLKSKDPRKEYFDKYFYPNINESLRQAIFEGRISPDIIKVHNRVDTFQWELKYKSNYHGNFQSSMNGEYFV
jgi:hypothetical protein